MIEILISKTNFQRLNVKIDPDLNKNTVQGWTGVKYYVFSMFYWNLTRKLLVSYQNYNEYTKEQD